MNTFRPFVDLPLSSAEYWKLQVLQEVKELENRKVDALAKRIGSDDVLLRIDDSSYAIVHVTFTANAGTQKLKYFDSFESIRENWQGIFGYDVEYEDIES